MDAGGVYLYVRSEFQSPKMVAVGEKSASLRRALGKLAHSISQLAGGERLRAFAE